jgi:hypothetical protein
MDRDSNRHSRGTAASEEGQWSDSPLSGGGRSVLPTGSNSETQADEQRYRAE